MKQFITKTIKNVTSSRVLYAAVLIAFIAVIGPFLISAANTLMTLLGIVLVVVLGYWGYTIVRNRYFNTQENK